MPCPWKMKVTFFSDNSEVTVEAVEGATDHVHEEDTDFVENSSKNFRWTDEMTKYVTEGIQNNHRPNFILRKMKKSNMFDNLAILPECYNKCAATKKTENPFSKISNTNELRNKVAESWVSQPLIKKLLFHFMKYWRMMTPKNLGLH